MSDSSSPGLPSVRIGDADRDVAVGELRQHYADGRLTLEEFLHRLPLVLQARTATDLDHVFADLPAVAVPPPIPRRRRRPGSPRRVLVAAAAAGAFAAGAVVATGWLASPAPPANPVLFRYECSQCVGAAGPRQPGAKSGAASREYQRAVGKRPAAKPGP